MPGLEPSMRITLADTAFTGIKVECVRRICLGKASRGAFLRVLFTGSRYLIVVQSRSNYQCVLCSMQHITLCTGLVPWPVRVEERIVIFSSM